MGVLYENGQGTGQDLKEAARWYALAAEQSVRDAAFNLGAMYATGRGVGADSTLAYKWFSLAAAAGDADAVRARDRLNAKMTREQIVKAQALAADWKPCVTVEACTARVQVPALVK